MTSPDVVVLPANQPRDRFYDGGASISAFRGDPPAPDHTPMILATIALVVSVGAFALSVLRRTRA